ncbi:MAG: hypothetical protein R3B93_28710 [Bacteroidia bacterium]
MWDQKAHKGSLKALEVSPDGKLLVSAGNDGQTFIWTIEGKKYAELEGHIGGVNDVVFTNDGKYLLTASDDKTVRRWLIDTAEILRKGKFVEVQEEVEIEELGAIPDFYA